MASLGCSVVLGAVILDRVEDAIHVRVELPTDTIQIERLSWWDSMLLSLRRFFA